MMDNPTRKYEIANEKRIFRAGLALVRLTAIMDGGFGGGYELKGLSVRGPRAESEDYLVTLRGLDVNGAPVVAFCGGMTLEDTFTAIQARIDNGTIRWRPDTFGR